MSASDDLEKKMPMCLANEMNIAYMCSGCVKINGAVGLLVIK